MMRIMYKQRICCALLLLALLLPAGCIAPPAEGPPPGASGALRGANSEPEPLPVNPEPEPENPPPQPLLYGRSFLEGEELALYDALRAAALNYDETPLPLSASVGEERARAVISALLGDHPTLYWASFTLEEEGGRRSLRLLPALTREAAEAQLAEIEARAAEILAGAADETPFALALAAHDAMALVPYDREEGPNGGNLYGALVEGRAYCNGYAAGFQHLARRAGLDCAYLTGRSLRGVRHAWNALLLDGTWHYVDPTWDRPRDALDDVYHDYFLISREEIMRDRSWDEGQYPALPDSGGSACYYRRMGYALEGEAPEELAAAVGEIFYRQLIARERYPADSAPVFVEFKVLGPPEDYALQKEEAVRRMFDIVRELARLARERNAPFTVADVSSVKVNFNDNLQVITFYPYIEALHS